jgi:hypothetical protein
VTASIMRLSASNPPMRHFPFFVSSEQEPALPRLTGSVV